jgi:hypothetical protein
LGRGRNASGDYLYFAGDSLEESTEPKVRALASHRAARSFVMTGDATYREVVHSMVAEISRRTFANFTEELLMKMHWPHRVALGTALWAFTLTPSFASYVTVALGGGTQTTTPGQFVSDAPNVDTYEQGVATYGRVRASTTASGPQGNGVATATFWVDFTLSSDAILAIGYHYDALLSTEYPGGAGYKFGISTSSPNNNITDPGQNAWTYLARGNSTGGMGDDHADFCPEFVGVQPWPTCSFHHGDSGVLRVPFQAGPNHLSVLINVTAARNAEADAYNTGEITGITVPDGVTFTYSDLSGNPLNVQSAGAAAATPEPSTWALGLCGIALTFVRKLRMR